VWVLLTLVLSGPLQLPPETIAAIQVHGNVLTPDDDVRRIAGLSPGMPFEPSTIETATSRLRAAKKFKSVQVLKRFASIADLSQILVVIIVDEGAVHIEMTGDPDHPTRVVRNRLPRVLILPILGAEDGYGGSYGVRLALPDPVGKKSRLAFPLTWGGVKRAAVEFEKSIDDKPIDRVAAGAWVSRVQNLYYDTPDDRVRVWLRGERELFGRALRVGATGGWQHVSFMDLDDRFVQVGGDVQVDTRSDPVLPRNAVFGRAAWEHLQFSGDSSSISLTGSGANRMELDGRGYVGLFGQTIFAVRAYRRDSNRPLPPYAQPLLGGMGSVRGFKVGTDVGDTLVTGSAELIVPLGPALSIGKIGVSAFADTGTVYDKGERIRDQVFKQGYGVGVWMTAAFFRFNVAVAYGKHASTRVHIGGDVTF
jgi:outer membrane protein assembly factor BamA